MRTTKWLVVGWLEHYYFNKSYIPRSWSGCVVTSDANPGQSEAAII